MYAHAHRFVWLSTWSERLLKRSSSWCRDFYLARVPSVSNCECSLTCIKSARQRLREQQRSGQSGSADGWRGKWNDDIRIWCVWLLHTPTHSKPCMATCTRPAQDQASQNDNTDGGGAVSSWLYRNGGRGTLLWECGCWEVSIPQRLDSHPWAYRQD